MKANNVQVLHAEIIIINLCLSKQPGTNKDSFGEDKHLNEPILLKTIAIIIVY